MNMEAIIKERINSAASFSEAEQFAEKLTYEISYEHKTAEWRSRYSYLRQEDFRKIGYEVLCIGAKDKNACRKFFLDMGYEKYQDSYYFIDLEKKILVMIDDYGNGNSISIDYPKEPTELISLDEYKGLLINKLFVLSDARDRVLYFVNSLVQDHKDFLANEINEDLKQHIINQALEKAREEKLIILS